MYRNLQNLRVVNSSEEDPVPRLFSPGYKRLAAMLQFPQYELDHRTLHLSNHGVDQIQTALVIVASFSSMIVRREASSTIHQQCYELFVKIRTVSNTNGALR